MSEQTPSLRWLATLIDEKSGSTAPAKAAATAGLFTGIGGS
ncbi:MAG: hypothetical protein ABIJ47_06825 [Candidatus Bathyarchaeota archaeon]